MKSVLLRAPVFTASGYGTHSRQVARWLFEKEAEWDLDISCEPLMWGQTSWNVNPEAFDGLGKKLLQASINLKPIYDVTLQLQLPNEWSPLLGKFNVGITAGVETDRCNPKWINNINQMNLVIVPSTFVKETFEKSGEVKTKIVVIPECFIDNLELDSSSSLSLDLQTDFNFLLFGQFTGNNVDNDRKNIAFTIKWFCEVFQDNPNVGLILKTNMAKNTKLDELGCSNLLTNLIMQVRQGTFPKIYLLHGELSDEEVAGLYKHPKVKALLTLTHGEGWGLPILEAAAAGLPIIATPWSGHMDFLKLGKFSKVEYKLEQIHATRVDTEIFMADSKWAIPSEVDSKRQLKRFYDSPNVPKEWALELQTKIRQNYNFQAISKQYTEILNSCLGK